MSLQAFFTEKEAEFERMKRASRIVRQSLRRHARPNLKADIDLAGLQASLRQVRASKAVPYA